MQLFGRPFQEKTGVIPAAMFFKVNFRNPKKTFTETEFTRTQKVFRRLLLSPPRVIKDSKDIAKHHKPPC